MTIIADGDTRLEKTLETEEQCELRVMLTKAINMCVTQAAERDYFPTIPEITAMLGYIVGQAMNAADRLGDPHERSDLEGLGKSFHACLLSGVNNKLPGDTTQ
jgi:hypothetical protein